MREICVKIVDLKQIGKVSFIRKASARNVKITIRPFKGVQVIIPGSLSIEKAQAFVDEKIPWIIQSQKRLSLYEKKITRFDHQTAFRTRKHELRIQTHSKATIRTVIGNGMIDLFFPDFADINDSRIQAAIRKAICQALRLEAAEYLPERLDCLAKSKGLTYRKITVRDNKTRWGSCSRDNNINLNVHLMRLPEHLCDYVILHELAHTLHKNHQYAFWHFLNSITSGRARELDKELNHWSPVVW